jgi:hypothetical protein
MNIRLLRAGRFAGLCLALALVFGACDNPAGGDDEDTTTAAEAKAAQTAADTFFIAHSAILDKTADMLGLDDEAPVTAALSAYRGLSAEARALLAAEKAHLDGLLVQIEALKNAADNGLYSRAADLGAWLAAQPENTPEDPYTVRYRGNELIRTLYDALAAAGRYAALDLSLSGVRGFASGTEEGRAFIVTLALPDSLTETPNGASTYDPIFQDYTNLKSVSAAGLIRLGDYAFYSINAPTSLTTVDLPKAETIGVGAFQYCTSLATVNLPEVVTISNYAFGNCTSLTSISLPKTVTMGAAIFSGCTALVSASLPELVTLTNNDQFANCSSLTTISLPKAASITNLEFTNCTSLRTVTAASVTTIAANAFTGCTALTAVNVLEVKTIGASAFQGCTALATVNWPKVETIGNTAFTRCTALTTVTLGSVPPSIGTTIFSQAATASKTITIRTRYPGLYTNAGTPWSDKVNMTNTAAGNYWDNNAATRGNLTVALTGL